LLQKLAEQDKYADYLKKYQANAPAPAAAPAPAMSGALGSGTFSMSGVPANALASTAPAPVAPVNQLADLESRYRIVSNINTPGAKADTELLKAQILEANKQPADVATMRSLGYPLTKEGYAAFRDAQRQERMLSPTEEAQKIRIALASRPPAPTVNVIQEKAEAGAYGKMLIDQYDKLVQSAELATKTLPSIEANLSALNKGLDTGFGTEAKSAAAKVLGALGVQSAEKYATDTQTFQSNAIQGLLQKQLEQKGPQTESDAQRIEQAGAQLGKTKAANEFILTVAKEQLHRDREQRDFYKSWKKKTGSFDGADDAWTASQGNKSLFDRPALKKYAVGAAPTETNKRTLGLDAIFNSQPQAR
jgi:hypothetical protein